MVGTLLGPEGAGPPGWTGIVRRWGVVVSVGAVRVLVPPAVSSPVRGWGRWGLAGRVPDGGRLVVENCTVDASIFFDCRPARERRSRGVFPFRGGGAWQVLGVGFVVVVWPSC